jgi:ATP-dependent RNA helicase RhlE
MTLTDQSNVRRPRHKRSRDRSHAATGAEGVPISPGRDVGFAGLGLDRRLLKAVADAGYEQPTPIQAGAIPVALAGHDVVGSAQTGTGKTAAFALPVLQRVTQLGAAGAANPVRDSRPSAGDGRRRPRGPRALVLTPTRELAGQIDTVISGFAAGTGLRVHAVYGGVPYAAQARRVRGGSDVLVATPGRLLDMINRGDVALGDVAILVLDEADRMLDMGFWPDIRRIIGMVPSERQNLLFSATMSKAVLGVIGHTLSEPVFVEHGPASTPVPEVEQQVLSVASDQKVDLLLEYFRQHEPETTLIFTRTRRRAARLPASSTGRA